MEGPSRTFVAKKRNRFGTNDYPKLINLIQQKSRICGSNNFFAVYKNLDDSSVIGSIGAHLAGKHIVSRRKISVSISTRETYEKAKEEAVGGMAKTSRLAAADRTLSRHLHSGLIKPCQPIRLGA